MAKSFGFRNAEQQTAQALWVELKALEQASPIDRGAVRAKRDELERFKEGNAKALGLKSKRAKDVEIYEPPKPPKEKASEPETVAIETGPEPEPEPTAEPVEAKPEAEPEEIA